jgi:hypothetical protein
MFSRRSSAKPISRVHEGFAPRRQEHRRGDAELAASQGDMAPGWPHASVERMDALNA